MKKKLLLIMVILLNNFFYFFVYSEHYALNSIPKCGTHLLLKTLKLIDKTIKDHISPKELYLLNPSILRIFLRKKVFLSSHAIHIKQNISLLNQSNIKVFFIYRDPRDQILSTAFMIKNAKWPGLADQSIDELITEQISDGGLIWGTIFNNKNEWLHLNGITNFYNLYLPWQYEPLVYTTTFEKLVGPKGGGDAEDQLNEIIAIAQHMGKTIDRNDAQIIANKMWGATPTFREGKIGSWKEYFSEQQKKDFKKIAGQLLIDLGYEKDLNW